MLYLDSIEKSKHEFYKSVRWRKKQKKILARDGYLCRECAKFGKVKTATIVHHIKHYDDFPELALNDENLISLCAKCHNKAHPEKAMHNHGRF